MTGSAPPPPPPPSPNAFLLRRRLRKELAQARQAAGLTQAQAADALGVSLSTVIRAELGETGITPKDALAYAQIYGIADRVDDLVRWLDRPLDLPWREYLDLVDKEGLEFFGYEASAAALDQYQNAVMPGLLQTSEYARHLLDGAFAPTVNDVERLLRLRRERQDHAWRGVVDHHFIVDEAVTRRRVGSAGVHRRQLQHLCSLIQQGVDIRVLPFSQGASFAVHGAFILVQLEEGEEEGIVYLEHSAGSRLIKDSNRLQRSTARGSRN